MLKKVIFILSFAVSGLSESINLKPNIANRKQISALYKRFSNIIVIMLLTTVSLIPLNSHPLERDCCREKKEKFEKAFKIADQMFTVVAPTAYILSGVTELLGEKASSRIVGVQFMFYGASIGLLLREYGRIQKTKYKKCLDGHIHEHEKQLELERIDKARLEKESQELIKAIQNEKHRLNQARSRLEFAKSEKYEIEKQFGWAKFHRHRIMEEYRHAWQEKSLIEAKLSHTQQQTVALKQKIINFNFNSLDSIKNVQAEPFTGSIEMELHGRDRYDSESEWIYTYYGHTKKVLLEEAREESREVLEQATQKDQELTSQLHTVQHQIESLQNKLDQGNNQLNYLRENSTQFEQAAEKCHKFWPEIGPLKDKVDEERHYFEHALRRVQKQTAELQDILKESENKLSQTEKDLYTLQKLKNRIENAKYQISSMDYQEQRNRALDHSKVVASELPQMAIESGIHSEEYSLFYEVSKLSVDLAISLNPVTGPPRDLYEALSGKHILTGEELNTFERSIAVVGVLTLGVGSKIIKASDVAFAALFKGSNALDSFDIGKKAFEAAHETWTTEMDLVHIVKGEFGEKAADGTFALKGGMHTVEGFTEFLALSKLSGKSYEIQEVTEFVLDKIPEGGPILMQKLHNGVTRLQLPRDAFFDRASYKPTKFKLDEGRIIRGIKSLWPDSHSIEDIAKITRDITNKKPSIVDNILEENIDGIKIVVRVNEFGRVSTSYPKWTN